MHKKIVVLYFIAMSSLAFSMELIIKPLNVILGSIYNESNSYYCMTCKEQQTDDKSFPLIVDPFETVILNRYLLILMPSQNFSVEKTIMLNEILPMGFPSKGWIKHVLYLKSTQPLIKLTPDLQGIKYSFFSAECAFSKNDEKEHIVSNRASDLEFDSKYILNVTIKRDDQIVLSFFKN